MVMVWQGATWVLLTTVLTLAIHDVGPLLAVVGSACGAPLMTVFPPLMLLRCVSFEGKWPVRCLHGGMCALGLLVSCAGAALALIEFFEPDDEDVGVKSSSRTWQSQTHLVRLAKFGKASVLRLLDAKAPL